MLFHLRGSCREINVGNEKLKLVVQWCLLYVVEGIGCVCGVGVGLSGTTIWWNSGHYCCFWDFITITTYNLIKDKDRRNCKKVRYFEVKKQIYPVSYRARPPPRDHGQSKERQKQIQWVYCRYTNSNILIPLHKADSVPYTLGRVWYTPQKIKSLKAQQDRR